MEIEEGNEHSDVMSLYLTDIKTKLIKSKINKYMIISNNTNTKLNKNLKLNMKDITRLNKWCKETTHFGGSISL